MLSEPYSAAKLFPDRLLLLLVLPQMSQSIALTATRTTLNNAEKLDSLGPALPGAPSSLFVLARTRHIINLGRISFRARTRQKAEACAHE
jgi:hypothetical protein